MPRDSSGNYTPDATNPVSSGTVIETSWANPTIADLAQALTDSLDRNGRGGMLVPFKNLDGTVSQPGMTWNSETSLGIYRAGTQDMRVSVGGADVMRWIAGAMQLWNGTEWKAGATEDQTIPVGTAMLFVQAAAPTGWTVDDTKNDHSLRIVSGGTTGGNSGGAVDFSTVFTATTATAAGGGHGAGVSGGTSLTVAQMPSHSHPGSSTAFAYLTNTAGAGLNGAGTPVNATSAGVSVASQGGGASHTHTIPAIGTHTHTTNLDVKYTDTIVCTKDAYA